MINYIKTSYTYLISCIPTAIIMMYIYLDPYLIEYKLGNLIFWGLYGLLLGVSVIKTYLERAHIREIITKGTCKEGTVEKLQEISMQTTLSRTGKMEDRTVYRVGVRVSDGFSGGHTYYSDAISYWKKKHIKNKAKVYLYMGEFYVLLEKSKIKMQYTVEKKNEVIKVNPSKAIMVFINRLALIVVIPLLIAFVYDYLKMGK